MNYAALPTPAIERAVGRVGERLRAAGALRGLSDSRAFDAVDDA